MPQNTKTIEMRVLNANISIIANDENEAEILEIFDFVKEKLENLKKRNPMTNAIQVAVLGCMNITEQLFYERKKLLDADRTITFLNEKNQSLNEALQCAEDARRILTDKTEMLQEEKETLQAERMKQELIITEKIELLERLWAEQQTLKGETADYRDRLVVLQEQRQAAEDESTEQKKLIKQLQEKLEAANSEIERSRRSSVDLQNQLFEAQIELDKWKKEI